jgi:hypothetical protein
MRASRARRTLGAPRAAGAIWINLLFESLEERLSRGAGAGRAVAGAGPRDFRCHAPVDVLGHEARQSPMTSS